MEKMLREKQLAKSTAPPLQKKEVDYYKMVPLLYAPILPLIRIGLRGRVPQQTLDRVFVGAVFVALGHGGYVILNTEF